MYYAELSTEKRDLAAAMKESFELGAARPPAVHHVLQIVSREPTWLSVHTKSFTAPQSVVLSKKGTRRRK
jgi:hypothetical protein